MNNQISKCWIYRRATLVNRNTNESIILDYSNGTRPQNLNVIHNEKGDKIFLWKVKYGDNVNVFTIPLNVDKTKVNSIVQKGEYNVENNMFVEWEYIAGKCESLWSYYLPYLVLCLLVLAVLFYVIISRKRNNELVQTC